MWVWVACEFSSLRNLVRMLFELYVECNVSVYVSFHLDGCLSDCFVRFMKLFYKILQGSVSLVALNCCCCCEFLTFGDTLDLVLLYWYAFVAKKLYLYFLLVSSGEVCAVILWNLLCLIPWLRMIW